jgi:hypothetical protein
MRMRTLRLGRTTRLGLRLGESRSRCRKSAIAKLDALLLKARIISPFSTVVFCLAQNSKTFYQGGRVVKRVLADEMRSLTHCAKGTERDGAGKVTGHGF